jgi:hypothetical protein
MIGLLVLGMVIVWLAAAIWIARRATRLIPVGPKWRPLVAIGLFLLVFFLPVADELAARLSFYALCKEGAVLRIDQRKIKGTTVALTVDPSKALLTGHPIPILHSHFAFRDARTGELLAEYDTYQARGGLIARVIALTGDPPLTGSFFLLSRTWRPTSGAVQLRSSSYALTDAGEDDGRTALVYCVVNLARDRNNTCPPNLALSSRAISSPVDRYVLLGSSAFFAPGC